MKRRVPLVLFLMGVLCALPSLAAPKRSPKAASAPASGPAWQPENALLSRLAAPVVVGAYELRPPRGYTLQGQPGAGPGVAWVGPARSNGVRPYLMMGLITVPAGEANTYSLEQILAKFLGGIQRQRGKDWQRTKAERGTIGGVPFVRASWSGTATGTPFKMHGFNYVALVGNQLIQLSSQDVEPQHQQALALAQAAALTFKRTARKTPAQPQGDMQILG